MDLDNKQKQSKPFWSLSAQSVLDEMGTDRAHGLDVSEVKERQLTYGANDLNDSPKVTGLSILWRQFKSPLIFILVIAVLATILLQEWFDAIIISLAIVVNTFLGYYQENKAENALAHLRSFVTVRTRVIRGGREYEIDAHDLVPGDLIHLTMGNRVPADARLVTAHGMRVDEAVLTGESLPVSKMPQVINQDAPLPDRVNMVYSGTLVTEGSGLAVVVGTAKNTEFGAIATLVRDTESETTPLQNAVNKLAWFIAVGVSVLVVGIFMLGVSRGEEWGEMFIVAVAVAVGAIPEALPIGLTAVLAVGVERLAKRKGIMRSLAATETLGSTNVVITDKTGTLTEAKLSLVDCFPTASLLRVSDRGDVQRDRGLSPSAYELLMVSIAGTNVVVENPDDELNDWVMTGNSLEKAIIKRAAMVGIKVPVNSQDRDFHEIIPFSSDHKFSVSGGVLTLKSDLTDRARGYAHVVMGAPDILLDRSKLSNEKRNQLHEAIHKQSEQGKRMVGVAVSYIEKAEQTHDDYTPDDIKDLQFIGVLAFFDPVRSTVPKAIKRIESYGVRVVMATGDLPGTATSVGRQLGWEIEPDMVISGSDLSKLSDAELDEKLNRLRIFARVTPADKLRLARAFQRQGNVVAMTGDGVNDAPSLKAVNIGIAVGSGSDVAKGVADLVLLDDNFGTIVAAIEEGRRVLRNIRKTFVYLMSNSLDGVILIGGSLLAGLALPLTAVQIIWVNFFTGSLPAVAFAFDRDTNLRQKGDKQVSEKIINGPVKFLALGIGVLTSFLLFAMYWFLSVIGVEEDLARTFIFATFASYILFVSFSLRSLDQSIFSYNPFSNKFLNIGVFIGLLLLALTIYVPFLQNLFTTVALPLWWLLAVLAWVGVNLVLVEVTKWFFYRLYSRQ